MNVKTNNITVKPVKKYSPPKYPTRFDATRSPELLRKLPPRWQKNAAVVAAVGMLGVMSLTSCGIANIKNDNTVTWDDLKNFVSIIKNEANNSDSERYLNVAPVFIYGEGTGSIGGLPPIGGSLALISDEEAFVIINSIAETAGLKFDDTPPEYTATKNKTGEKYTWEDGHEEEITLGDGNINLELYDSEKNVAITYISMNEAAEMPETSTVISYRPRELAELTVEDFSQQKGDSTIGVLYAPGLSWYGDTQRLEQDLREQVRDFIEWLQGQGII